MSNNFQDANYLPKVKLMSEDDLKRVWTMRNDPEVLKFAQSNQPVSWAEFESVFKFTDYPKLVFKNETTGDIIGYVDFRNDLKDENIKEWSFFIAEEHRGRGWSSVMLDAALEFAKELGYTTIKGTVKVNNELSIKVHESLGFNLIESNKNENIYLIELS